MRGWILAFAAIAGSVPAAAQANDLPIARGFWINAADQCASATNGYAFDGARWGAVYFYGPGGSMGPAIELEAITQTRPVAGGFTYMQFGGYDGVGYFYVKSLGPDRMMLRTGAPGPEGIQVMDDTLVGCGMGVLSAKMQTALRRAAPALPVK
ncbi:hypothetical protein FHR22_001892 [Sphingopyxis panaciterrae]|uniref:hypothetical protein n=1 Tax=Sphingopyxis panaciterrae TaxID=363841 RepID=UPI001421B380|nr:hypothetical protein [Sphingopyxis panaciterrae]NIJ37208.1 hypothetical protein [Sphingopyxis panaciterrae]